MTPEVAELARASGLELAAYRPDYVADRIARSIAREGVADAAALGRLVRSDAGARTRFRRSVAVSVSGIFRDQEQFDVLEHELLPPLVASKRRLSVWSAGCADGSELVSIGLVLSRLGALDRAFLLGSDVLDENIEAARSSSYGDVEVSPEVRAKLRFERRDLVREPVPGRGWQLILCRNLVIYLAPGAKSALLEKLARALARDGVLLLGKTERIADPAELGLERAAPHAFRRAA